MDGFKNLFRLNTTEETSLLSEDVISLVETWMTIETTLSGHFSKYNLIQSLAVRESTRGRGKGGVILLVNKMVFEIRVELHLREFTGFEKAAGAADESDRPWARAVKNDLVPQKS
jgi:hypothetical protein